MLRALVNQCGKGPTQIGWGRLGTGPAGDDFESDRDTEEEQEDGYQSRGGSAEAEARSPQVGGRAPRYSTRTKSR